MKYPSVDVIIPTYKPDHTFSVLLRRLTEQKYPVSNILIINTEERYWDPELIREIPQAEVFHISKKEFDHAGTRNMGAGFSTADYIVFMTQDAMPKDRKLINNLLKPFKDPYVKISYARQIPRRDCRIIEGYVRNFNYPDESMVKTADDIEEMGIKAFFCSDVCACYDRKFHKSMGGFYVPSIFNEDMVFAAEAMKKGYSIAYAADARVIHSHNYTAMQQFHRNFDNGVSQAMHPEVFDGLHTEGEGMRLVKETAEYLNQVGRSYLIPNLFYQSIFKFLGFKLGEMYASLPEPVVKLCSQNKAFWSYSNIEEE